MGGGWGGGGEPQILLSVFSIRLFSPFFFNDFFFLFFLSDIGSDHGEEWRQLSGRVPDLRWKGIRFESRPERRQFFSSPGSIFSADSYFGIHSTPVLPQQHVQDPGHSAKSEGGRLQLDTLAPCHVASNKMTL